jgi:hypothetical protein
MICRRPSVFGGAIAGSAPTSSGLRNFVSSTRPWPSGVRIIVMSTWTPSSPFATPDRAEFLTISTVLPKLGLVPRCGFLD